MTWSMSEPQSGDMIRVKAGNLWHYGIYVSDDEVIQFGATPTAVTTLVAQDVAVISSDMDAFLLGGFLEVAVYDKKERRKKRSNSEIVQMARSRLGEKGYHLLHNNCEHFAHECVFGEHTSSQVEDVRRFFRAMMPLLDVYVAEIPADVTPTPVYPHEREEEINACTHDRVRAEKYMVWKLLSYAIEKSFGYKMEKLVFEKTENGKWTSPSLYFSLSHGNGVVAVAVSRKPVGIDVELAECPKAHRDSFQERILNQEELAAMQELPADKREAFLIESWTRKESAFKREGGKSFSPTTIRVQDTKSMALCYGGKPYVLSVTNDDLDKLRLFQHVTIS